MKSLITETRSSDIATLTTAELSFFLDEDYCKINRKICRGISKERIKDTHYICYETMNENGESIPQYELSFEAIFEVLEDYTLKQQVMVLEAFRQLVCTKKLRVSEQVKISFPRTYLYYLIDIIERELEIAGYSPSI